MWVTDVSDSAQWDACPLPQAQRHALIQAHTGTLILGPKSNLQALYTFVL